MMMSRALKSIGEASTLSASAPEFFAASIAPGTSSTFATRWAENWCPRARARSSNACRSFGEEKLTSAGAAT
jgi:hypothetical protein